MRARTPFRSVGRMLFTGLSVLALVACCHAAASAQPGAASQPAAAAAPGGQPTPAKAPRKLAPGVLHQVDPAVQVAESVARHDVIGLLAENADLDWAKAVAFRRDIWHLEFRYKNMRMIQVDLPQPDGRMQRKLIWYLVYTVTNPGKALRPVQQPDGTYQAQQVDLPVFFVPEFRLASHEFNKVYPDRVIPAAIGPIRTREDPALPLLSSVDMTRQIEVGETLWGVATWEDVDPLIDRFSIYVGGLTNAYRWIDDPAQYTRENVLSGRRFLRKWLKLNFWRPGDEYYEHEKEFRVGIPGEVDYEWVYR